MSLPLDLNNYNPRNIGKNSPQIPSLESGEVDRAKYAFLCGSRALWDLYSEPLQSCLVYSYVQRVKVARNTDRKLFIVEYGWQ